MKEPVMAFGAEKIAGTVHAGSSVIFESGSDGRSLYESTGKTDTMMAQRSAPLTGKGPALPEPLCQLIEQEIYANTAAYDFTSAANWAISYCMDNWLAMVHQAQRGGLLKN